MSWRKSFVVVVFCALGWSAGCNKPEGTGGAAAPAAGGAAPAVEEVKGQPSSSTAAPAE